jgi:DNA (cytosine-5)-methyltransferase 1
MKYLSVCSGIEAATAAWHGMNLDPVAFSEIEKFLAKFWPTTILKFPIWET